jgi:hypothetical protein
VDREDIRLDAVNHPCVCGATMKRAEWQEFSVSGGLRDVSGFACDTDGCEGNFPQFWERMIKVKNGNS